jgi:hypothetical protein
VAEVGFVDGDEIPEWYRQQLIYKQIHGKPKLNNKIQIGDQEECNAETELITEEGA